LPWALVGFIVVVLGMNLGIVFHSASPQARVASIAKAKEAAGTVRLTAISRPSQFDVLAAGKVKTALGHATTKRQIRAAVVEIVGSHPKEVPFITYILAQCERPAPSGAPATQ
jgi:hypothetical protein